VYGALHLCSVRQSAFDGRHLALAERVADQIAGAISQSKLNSELELEVKQRESLAEISRIIGSSLDIDEVYEHFADQLRLLIPFDRLSISIPDAERRFNTLSYLSGIEVGDQKVGFRFPLEGTLVQETLTSRSSVLIQGVDRGYLAEHLPALLASYDSGLRSFLAVPLLHHGDTVAVLEIWSRAGTAYTDGHVNLADRVGSQIAGAIANSILYAERTNLQNQLSQSQKMEAVGRLAGGIAHDFNNLMTPILSYTQMGADLTSKGSELGRYLQEIHKAGERAAQLTRQLLTFSRHQVLERSIIDLNDLIMNVDKMLRRLIGANVELVYLPREGLRMVNVDPGQIEQVLVNLVVNARDAMPGGGRIVVATDNVVLADENARINFDAEPGEYVMFKVSDNGAGIAKENIEHIFEPFFTTKAAGTGTGLGLSTSFGTVSRIGGFITVESEPGQGAAFKVYLPAANGVPSVVGDQVYRDDLTECDETILVVEDEHSVLKVACELLRVQGYKVVEATNGHDALRCARDPALDTINLLLSDMVMPLMGGVELAGQMREIHPETRVLFTSGYMGEELADAGYRAKEVGFLPKPYTPDSLLGSVRQVLDE
jgi:signal transduction histidine kinase/CheY-like chemotaxis protein